MHIIKTQEHFDKCKCIMTDSIEYKYGFNFKKNTSKIANKISSEENYGICIEHPDKQENINQQKRTLKESLYYRTARDSQINFAINKINENQINFEIKDNRLLNQARVNPKMMKNKLHREAFQVCNCSLGNRERTILTNQAEKFSIENYLALKKIKNFQKIEEKSKSMILSAENKIHPRNCRRILRPNSENDFSQTWVNDTSNTQNTIISFLKDNFLNFFRFIDQINTKDTSNKIISAILTKYMSPTTPNPKAIELLENLCCFAPKILLMSYILLKRYSKVFCFDSFNNLKNIFYVCCIISIKIQSDAHLNNINLAHNSNMTEGEINYLEGSIIYGIDYNLNFIDTDFRASFIEISNLNNKLY